MRGGRGGGLWLPIGELTGIHPGHGEKVDRRRRRRSESVDQGMYLLFHPCDVLKLTERYIGAIYQLLKRIPPSHFNHYRLRFEPVRVLRPDFQIAITLRIRRG